MSNIFILGKSVEPIDAIVLHLDKLEPMKVHAYLKNEKDTWEINDYPKRLILLADEHLEAKKSQLKVLRKAVELVGFEIAGVMGDECKLWSDILQVPAIDPAVTLIPKALKERQEFIRLGNNKISFENETDNQDNDMDGESGEMQQLGNLVKHCLGKVEIARREMDDKNKLNHMNYEKKAYPSLDIDWQPRTHSQNGNTHTQSGNDNDSAPDMGRGEVPTSVSDSKADSKIETRENQALKMAPENNLNAKNKESTSKLIERINELNKKLGRDKINNDKVEEEREKQASMTDGGKNGGGGESENLIEQSNQTKTLNPWPVIKNEKNLIEHDSVGIKNNINDESVGVEYEKKKDLASFLTDKTDEKHGSKKKITGRVRSGQVVEYEGDIVIEGNVHAGAEIRSGGDIHVYGVCGGRVYTTNKNASIYIDTFDAELVSIGGKLLTHDDLPEKIIGRNVRISFDDGKLIFKRIGADKAHMKIP